MSSCPSCHQPVEDDFGMVTCPHCSHIFMVGLEADEAHAADAELAAELPQQPSGEDLLMALNDPEGEELSSPETSEGFDPPLMDEPLEEPASPELEASAELDPPVMGEPLQEFTSQTETKEFAQELSEFAEQEDASGDLYQYQLKISAAGPQDIVPNLRQVLKDVGLEELDFEVSPDRDEITLPWVGAIWAHRLVARLRKLPVFVKWDQRHALKE